MCARIGLDTFAGIVHSRERAKPAFIFDVAEPYRPLIDLAVLKKLALQSLPGNNNEENLVIEERKQLISIINSVFEEKILAQDDGKSYCREEIMELELRRLAKYISQQKVVQSIFEDNFI